MSDRPLPQPWRLIPAAEYAFPAAPPSQRLRRGLRSWLRRLRSDDDRPVEIPLAALAEARLSQLVPELPTEEQASAVLEALEDGGGRLLVLTPPDGSWTAAVVRAAQRLEPSGVTRLPPPAQRSMGRISQIARRALAGGGGVAIPRLEHWFLRHHDGLASCRELLSALAERPAPLLVGCDAWSWLFLSRALAAPACLPAPLLPAALEADGLEVWLDPPAGLRQRADGNPPGRAFFQRLAAEGLGLPGLIRDLWRECLRRGSAADDAAGEEAEGDRAELWLRSPEEGMVPAASVVGEGLVLLYSLLLNGGLSRADLHLCLPFSEAALARLLAELERAGVIVRETGIWRIERRAYPEVRRQLAHEGYLVGVV